MVQIANQNSILSLKDVRIQDSFWSDYIRLVREVVVPYQWDALNDRIPGAEPSRAIRNLQIAAGETVGEFHGMVFQDSDVAKWLEAVGYLLACERDPLLRDTIGKVALQRGPLVYCLEEADNGKYLHRLFLPGNSQSQAAFDPDKLGGVHVIRMDAERLSTGEWGTYYTGGMPE